MHRGLGIQQQVTRGLNAPRTANRLLALSLDAWLTDSTEIVELKRHQRLANAGVRPVHVFFPEAAVLSVMRHVGSGDRMEVASIGNEGMNALPLFFGARSLASDSEVLTGGSARRMPVDKFLEAAACRPLRAALYAYADFLFGDMERALVCARFHSVPQQFARWLLQNADRMGRDDFHYSHDFIAKRMGVRRATISDAVLSLKRQGIVSSGRSRIVIQDRARLREVSCACYAANRGPSPCAAGASASG
jgi:CRP-like cAMP-binding protein